MYKYFCPITYTVGGRWSCLRTELSAQTLRAIAIYKTFHLSISSDVISFTNSRYVYSKSWERHNLKIPKNLDARCDFLDQEP